MVIPEPFTVLASSLGFAATIFNFLLNTITSSEQRFHQFRHMDDKLSKARDSLSDAQYTFALFLDTLTRKPLDDHHCEDEFGAEEWADIKRRIDRIQRQICELRKDLHIVVQPDKPKLPAPEQQPQRFGSSAYKRIKKHFSRGINKGLHRSEIDIKGAQKTEDYVPVPETTFPSLENDEYAAWRDYLCSDPPAELRNPPVPLQVGHKIIAILSAKWERIDRSVTYLNDAIDSLTAIAQVYRDKHLGRKDESSREVEDERRRRNFSKLATYIFTEMIKLQSKLPNIGWHLQVGAIEGLEHSPRTRATLEPQEVLNEIVADCHFIFAAHTDIDSEFLTRGLELKAARGHMIPPNPRWMEFGDLESEDKLQQFLKDDDWKRFLRVESLPDHTTFRLKASRDQRIRLWTKDWRKLLAEEMTDEVTRKMFAVERARLVFGLTIWMILLWEKDWFSHICTCCLRCVFFGDSKMSDSRWDAIGTNPPFVLPSLQHVYFNGTPDRTPRVCVVDSCNKTAVRPSAEKRLQFFAILLAEIILARKIEVDQNGRPAGKDSDSSEDELVECVERDIDCRLAKGLHFCFERAGDDSNWDKLPPRAKQKELVEHVLKPAKQYYEAVSSRPENERWLNKLYEKLNSQDLQDMGFQVS